jgi:hypothetical protein
MAINDGDKVEGKRELVPVEDKKKEFKLKMLIPPGQRVPVGIAS